MSRNHLGKVCVQARPRVEKVCAGRKEGCTMTTNKESLGLQKGTSHSYAIQWSGVVVVVISFQMHTPTSICLQYI